MVSTSARSPIFCPARSCWACGAWVMLSCPPATMMRASPDAICWAASATARRPDPQSWLMPKAVCSTGMPAFTEAWRAGFWPEAAVRIWPMMTSSTSPPSMPARSMAALIAAVPSTWAGTEAKAPLKAPTGVRAAEAMTISVMTGISPLGALRRRCASARMASSRAWSGPGQIETGRCADGGRRLHCVPSKEAGMSPDRRQRKYSEEC